MRGKSTLALLAVAAFTLASVPMASAHVDDHPSKAIPTTLYFHIFDTFNAFPINTQAPNTEFFRVGGTNFPTVVEGNTQTNYDFNTVYGFATSGPVEYDFIENGQPRFHPERGIASDIKIDQGTDVYAYMYLSVRDVLGSPDGAPNYLPSFTFRLAMREGNVIGPDSDLDAGALIMDGQLTAHVWDDKGTGIPAPPAADNLPTLVPDASGIVEFKIKMNLQAATIPKTNAYNIRLDWFQNPSGDASNDDKFAEGYMRLVSDKDHHPRLEMAITNPVYIDYIHPEVAAGILLIHTAENSPWGTYDVDVENITIEITGPSTPLDLPVVISQNQHVHNLHDKSAEVTYLWRFRDEGAAEGSYKIHLVVKNKAHTQEAHQEASFVIEAKRAYGIDEKGNEVKAVVTEDTESSPGPSLLVVGVLLVGAVLVRRRKA